MRDVLKINRLVESIAGQPSPPCNGCYERSRCAVNELACKDFNNYVHNRQFFAYSANRNPLRAHFRSVFNSRDR